MSGRAREMIARLGRTWPEAGVAPSACSSLVDRAERAMKRRSARFPDEHHPAFLHPLRTAVLLLEADETDPRAHAVALELDTEGGDGAPDDAEVDALLSADPDERLELLVLADPWLLHTWLAERLDQIRHLHLWAGPDRTRDALDRAEREELPLAQRAGGRLARAWTDWLDKAHRYRLVERSETRPVADAHGS